MYKEIMAKTATLHWHLCFLLQTQVVKLYFQDLLLRCGHVAEDCVLANESWAEIVFHLHHFFQYTILGPCPQPWEARAWSLKSQNATEALPLLYSTKWWRNKHFVKPLRLGIYLLQVLIPFISTDTNIDSKNICCYLKSC